MSEDAPWHRLLCEALVVLALPPDEQVLVNGPGCIACDLLEEFDHARTVTLGNAPNLSDEQRGLLDWIDNAIRAMEQPDFECFNNEVVRRPVWQQLRELAAEALRVFGWERVGIQPFMEVQPGVWQRPVTDAELGPTAERPRE